MALIVKNEKIPLQADAHGVWRVGGTRVTLDTIIFRFREGGTPEEIVQRYPSLELADVYLVVAWYLRHQKRVDSYLAERESEAERIQRDNSVRWPNAGIRNRLLSRARHQGK